MSLRLEGSGGVQPRGTIEWHRWNGSLHEACTAILLESVVS